MDFNVTNILYALAALGGLGFLFGAILAVSAKAFHVKRDARVEEIMKILPCANCGMCGFTGCDAYATAVTKGDAPVSGCSVGGENVAEKVAEVMGTETGEVEEKKRAVAACCGSSKPKFNYVGTKDCLTLSKLGEGVGACQYAACSAVLLARSPWSITSPWSMRANVPAAAYVRPSARAA